MAAYQDTSDFASLAAAVKGLKSTTQQRTEQSAAASAVVGAVPPSVHAQVPSAPTPGPTTTPTTTTATVDASGENPFAQTASETLAISQHRKAVTSLCVEASGSRFYSGSQDGTVAYWDFKGMARERGTGRCVSEPFRFITPTDGAQGIRQLQPSSDGQWLLVVGGGSAARLFDRNGSMVREFSSGDPYIRDLRHTGGHVAALTCATWVPTDPDRFLTASEDGTVRLWHCGHRRQSEQAVVVRGGPGPRVPVTALAAAGDSTWWATGSADGALRLWRGLDQIPASASADARAPAASIHVPFAVTACVQAHAPGSALCALATTPAHARWLASRARDGTVALWDVRASAAPLVVHVGADATHAGAALAFSPDAQWLLAGTADGCLLALGTRDPGARWVLATRPGVPCTAVAWCARSAQIFCGWGDGSITVLHGAAPPGRAAGVALMRVVDAPQAPGPGAGPDADAAALPLADIDMAKAHDRDAVSAARAPTKRRREKIRADPRRTLRPELPLRGPGEGGRIGSSVTQAIMRSVLKDTSRDADPRDALLRFAARAAQNPTWVTPAYQHTQPQPILDPLLLEKETHDAETRRRRIEEAERLQRERDRKGA